jgi:hypothetical protein
MVMTTTIPIMIITFPRAPPRRSPVDSFELSTKGEYLPELNSSADIN